MPSSLPLPVALEAPGVRWSVEVLDHRDSQSYLLGSEQVLSSASIGKLLLLAEVARQVDAGELPGELLLSRTDDDQVSDSGLWQYLGVQALSVLDAATLVAAVSDNLATNVLLRRVGLARVQQLGSSLGFAALQLHDRVRDVRTSEHPERLSSASAADLVRFFDLLLHSQLVSSSVSQLVGSWLQCNADLSMVASAYGLDPLAHHGSVLANKTGTDTGVRADSGFVVGVGGRVVYAAIANWSAADGDLVDAVLRDMRSIGAFVRELSDAG